MSLFTIETLEAVADDIKTQKVRLDRMRILDDEVAGLRAIISANRIAFHVSYKISDTPFQMHIGDATEISVEAARIVATYVRKQGQAGINVQEESRQRTLEKLWRDAGAVRPS